jgi:hypothetical protein
LLTVVFVAAVTEGMSSFLDVVGLLFLEIMTADENLRQ